MCADVEPGIRTAAAVAWEAAAKISLLVLAFTLCSMREALQEHVRAAAVAAVAAGVAAARGGGGLQEAIRPSRWWSRIV